MTTIKRAITYITRKKTSTLVMTILLFVVFSFLQTGVILQNSAALEIDSIKESQDSVLIIEQQKIDQNDLSLETKDVYDPISGTTITIRVHPQPLDDELAEAIKSLDDVVAYNAEKKTPHHTEMNVKEGFFTRNYQDLLSEPDIESDAVGFDSLISSKYFMKEVNLYSNTNSELHKFFRIGACELVAGRHITKGDKWTAIVSDDFANRNNLSVGDTVNIDLSEEEIEYCYSNLPGMTPAEFTLNVVGIYHINFITETSEYTAEREIPENIIFIDNYSMLEIERQEGIGSNNYDVITFFAENSVDMDHVISCIKENANIKWEYLNIEKDSSRYSSLVVSLETIQGAGITLIVVSAGSCFIVLLLVFSMRIKSRRREIGILISLGIEKKNILRQFYFEVLIIYLVAFMVSVIVSNSIMPLIGNELNTMFVSGNGISYEMSLDDSMFIDINISTTNLNVDYEVSIVSLLWSFVIGAFAVFIPIMLTIKKMFNHTPRELLL